MAAAFVRCWAAVQKVGPYSWTVVLSEPVCSLRPQDPLGLRASLMGWLDTQEAEEHLGTFALSASPAVCCDSPKVTFYWVVS